jgi:hypothetical protein
MNRLNIFERGDKALSVVEGTRSTVAYLKPLTCRISCSISPWKGVPYIGKSPAAWKAPKKYSAFAGELQFGAHEGKPWILSLELVDVLAMARNRRLLQ